MPAGDALTLDELRDLFVARGYHKTPICLDGLPEKHRNVLLEILRTLVRERDEDVEVQTRLLARNQELERSVQRTQRTTKQASDKTHSTEVRLHTIESQLAAAQRALREEQSAHKATREQLQRTRRDMQHVKAAAVQHRTVTDRSADRLRDRLASASLSNLKALVPDIRIASPAFVARAGAPDASLSAEQQLAAAEQRNVALMDASHALKQLAVDALTTMHHADVRLQKILDVEAPTDKPRARARADNGGAEWGAAQLFPPLRPLVSDDTEETHPARGRLWTLSRALQEHVAQLSQWAAMRHVRVSEPGAGARPSDVAAAEHEQGEVEAELGGTMADAGAADDLGGGKRRRVSAT